MLTLEITSRQINFPFHAIFARPKFTKDYMPGLRGLGAFGI
jgi:hypothetical protein